MAKGEENRQDDVVGMHPLISTLISGTLARRLPRCKLLSQISLTCGPSHPRFTRWCPVQPLRNTRRSRSGSFCNGPSRFNRAIRVFSTPRVAFKCYNPTTSSTFPMDHLPLGGEFLAIHVCPSSHCRSESCVWLDLETFP